MRTVSAIDASAGEIDDCVGVFKFSDPFFQVLGIPSCNAPWRISRFSTEN